VFRVLKTERIQHLLSAILLFLHFDCGFLEVSSELCKSAADILTVLGIAGDLTIVDGTCESYSSVLLAYLWLKNSWMRVSASLRSSSMRSWN
jgi:hypothetical protein